MSSSSELKPQGPRGIAYDRPTKIAARHAKRFLWGDDQAGWVSDWIYGSSPKIHMMAFSMNVGARFGNPILNVRLPRERPANETTPRGTDCSAETMSAAAPT